MTWLRSRTNPDRLEEAPQGVRARQRDRCEDDAQRHVVAERRTQAEKREHRDLRRDREAITHRNIGARLDQGHAARLLLIHPYEPHFPISRGRRTR